MRRNASYSSLRPLRGFGGEGGELAPDERRHRDELVALLQQHRGNLSAIARVVGNGRTQVARYRLDIAGYRSG